ncbi:MAG: 50S ribosomal protein L18 [Candidatus Latescibacteria bacterium]|nr:50S ribosomal protein L18 [Candidatus Latescibacterota bacterium]
MKHAQKIKMTAREKRAKRVRSKVVGTIDRPRMSVYRSLNNVYVQLIDDTKGVTLVGVSSIGTEINEKDKGKVGVSKVIGKIVAEKAKEKGITQVVFDRSGYLYHGRIKAVAEGAREGGLIF